MIVTLSKYIFVGIANTLLTLSISFILIYIGINLYWANAAGYLFGFLLSFILNSIFTFSVQLSFNRFIKFLITFLGCYFLNLLSIKIFLSFFAFGMKSAYWAQLFGMCIYTFSSFFVNKFWVMK